MREEDVLLDEITDGCGMDSVLDVMHLAPETWYTYKQSEYSDENCSRIDHVFVSSGMIQQGIVTRAGVYNRPLLRSRHRMILLELDIRRALNVQDNTLPKPEPPPVRALRYNDLDQRTKFRNTLDHMAQDAGIEGAYRRCKVAIENGLPKANVRKLMDSLMDLTHTTIVQAANSLVKYKHRPSKKFKNGMSPAPGNGPEICRCT